MLSHGSKDRIDQKPLYLAAPGQAPLARGYAKLPSGTETFHLRLERRSDDEPITGWTSLSRTGELGTVQFDRIPD